MTTITEEIIERIEGIMSEGEQVFRVVSTSEGYRHMFVAHPKDDHPTRLVKHRKSLTYLSFGEVRKEEGPERALENLLAVAVLSKKSGFENLFVEFPQLQEYHLMLDEALKGLRVEGDEQRPIGATCDYQLPLL
jgi:hypothetical protein